MTLILHAGANPIDYDELRLLTTPPGTPTHVPIPHHRVVDLAAYSLSYFGHEVVERKFGVTEDGMRFFCVMMLRSPDEAGVPFPRRSTTAGSLIAPRRRAHTKR